MNERIKELAHQAGFELNPAHFDHKKFAELIVKECANWINNNVRLIDDEAKADLLKHFGLNNVNGVV